MFCLFMKRYDLQEILAFMKSFATYMNQRFTRLFCLFIKRLCILEHFNYSLGVMIH